jgi:hypothetical protein
MVTKSGKSKSSKATGKKTVRSSAARKARKAGAKGRRPAPIPQNQWNLPASYSADGTLATLREVADPKVPTLSLPELSPAQRADVVVKRIEAQPKFEIAMLGAGLIDKERAIAEVKAGSKVGRALMEIEQRVINNLVSRAMQAKDKPEK